MKNLKIIIDIQKAKRVIWDRKANNTLEIYFIHFYVPLIYVAIF